MPEPDPAVTTHVARLAKNLPFRLLGGSYWFRFNQFRSVSWPEIYHLTPESGSGLTGLRSLGFRPVLNRPVPSLFWFVIDHLCARPGLELANGVLGKPKPLKKLSSRAQEVV